MRAHLHNAQLVSCSHFLFSSSSSNSCLPGSKTSKSGGKAQTKKRKRNEEEQGEGKQEEEEDIPLITTYDPLRLAELRQSGQSDITKQRRVSSGKKEGNSLFFHFLSSFPPHCFIPDHVFE